MMESSKDILLPNLLLMLFPVAIVAMIYVKWSLNVRTLYYASARMVVQLIVVGYALVLVFEQETALVPCLVLVMMLLVSSWIALRPIHALRRQLYTRSLLAIAIGGVPILALVVVGVVQLRPWYTPKYLIPLAGMIFANAMNSVSLCAERYHSERESGKPYITARDAAYKAALIPLINSFFAVGLVSLPGMMTGQILAGVSPLLAVRYQMMVMCMLLGASGIASAVFLTLMKGEDTDRA